MNSVKSFIVNYLSILSILNTQKNNGGIMINPNIIKYWNQIFGLIGKDYASEKELVFAMLAFHTKEPTATNQTRCLNKIFKDTYRAYLLCEDFGKRIYCINHNLLVGNEK
ncbi:hypothetical protein D9V84_10470 [Bacteroidetes/Chlorobi group bacterium Naka2016]|jgi:hypothetical protein|nr:MAG: hypothetical protein D9V84_10470 [Bacteroidetes/Chlorobi group bacterium Naka2016]